MEERLTLCIVETRKIICFLRAGQKPNHEYAILTRAFDATVDQCCTCLNQKDHLQTYSYKDIDLAIKRLHNKNDYCPLKDNTPTAQLQRLLLDRMLTMTPSLEEVVAAMEIKFEQEVEEAAAKKPVRVSKKKRELQDGHACSPLTTQNKLLIPPLTIYGKPNDAPLQNTVPEDEANSDKMDRRSEADKNLTNKTTQREDQAERLVQEKLDELWREHELAANGVAIDARIADDVAVLMVQYKEKALDDKIQGDNANESKDAVGKKTMSEKVKQRIQHRKKKQLAVKKRQLLPEIVEGVTKKRKIRLNGTQNNDAISLATNDGKTLTNVVPTSLLGKKRKKDRLIRIVKKRREIWRKEAEQRKAESAQELMEGQNEDHDVEQSDWRWDEVYETWMYEPLQEKTKPKRKKNLTNKSLKNRILAMRRTWNTPKKDEMIAKISINRSELHTVR